MKTQSKKHKIIRTVLLVILLLLWLLVVLFQCMRGVFKP